MKTHTEYECEICGRRYRDQSDCAQCEATPAGRRYPVGLMWSGDEGEIYENMSFAIAQTEIVGHNTDASEWACRDNGSGDSLGENTCGSGGFYRPREFDPTWLSKPSWDRMVAWLEGRGIIPMVWVNGHAVPLSVGVWKEDSNL